MTTARPSVMKKQREQKKRERQQAKLERRAQRKLESERGEQPVEPEPEAEVLQ